jgi:hypothetical protein
MTPITPVSIIARTCGAVILIVAVATTSACATPALPTAAGTPSTIPATTTEGTTDPGSSAPANPCQTLLDPTEVAVALGAPGTVLVGTEDPLLAVVGGFECEYSFRTSDPESDDEEDPEVSERDMVYVAVAPASVTTPAVIAASLVPENCAPDLEQQVGCFATVSVGGWWYSLSVLSSISPTVQKASFEKITTQLEGALSDVKPPAQVTGVAPFDCTWVKTGGLTVRRSRTLSPARIGSEMYSAAFLLVGPVMCEFTIAENQTWDLTVYPGGASAFDQCRFAATGYDPNSSPLEVEGVDSVYELSNTGDEDRYCATDGTSLIRVYHEFFDEDVEEAEPEVTLGALLPPTFAAIDAAR